MDVVEYWKGNESVIVSREVRTFPAFDVGQPLDLNGVPYYIDNIAWAIDTAEDPSEIGESHNIKMIVRLDPV